MADNPKFGSEAQTVQQHANILRQMEVVCPGLVTKASAYTQGLYGRYVAGELSWGEVRSLRGLNEASVPQGLGGSVRFR
jgi:hypothetical protein